MMVVQRTPGRDLDQGFVTLSHAKLRPVAGQAQPGAPGSRCFHCEGPLPADDADTAVIAGRSEPVCCAGCRAAVEYICAAGLGDYYRRRAAPAPRPPKAGSLDFADYDDPQFQSGFVACAPDGTCEATLVIEGIVCPSCAWLNEERLRRVPGVIEAQVNYTNHRARVRWESASARLSGVLGAIHDFGYAAHPYSRAGHDAALERERELLLKRLGVATALGMQVMMFAVALYAGDFGDEFAGREALYREFFRWVMCLLTLPVVLYSSQAFFEPAWRSLRNGTLGMDVPVSLGILVAFIASVAATVAGGPDVYYDSVTMFVALLLGGRYLEFAARLRAAETGDNLVRLAPVVATRLTASGEERVPAARLRPGDRIRVRPGEQVPADAVVVAGESGLDESLLTGESAPRRRGPGDVVMAGSVNADGVLECAVTQAGEATVLAQVLRLLERAQAARPALTRVADRAAAWFIGAVLLLAAGVAWGWWQAGGDWVGITVAVLVVSCPCALSLATPAALTAGTGAMMRRGLLAVRPDAIEALAGVGLVAFDKTGTLTCGRPALVDAAPLRDVDAARCLLLAAALERHANHPLATALREAAQGLPGVPPVATAVTVQTGRGVEGTVGGRRVQLGSAAFTGVVAAGPAGAAGETQVWLADDTGALCRFRLRDPPRPDAAAAVAALAALGIETALLSGDDPQTVAAVAADLGVRTARGGLLPAAKLAALQSLRAGGRRVAMVGDGVNDAPVLAAADVGIAMGGGTDVARAQADLILLGDALGAVVDGIRTARRTLAIVRQNIGWAIAYNVVALPAAAAGWVPPWLAAIGMSASSLAVVLNALRLLRTRS